MIQGAKNYFSKSAFGNRGLAYDFFLEMRYNGQEHTVTIKYLKSKDDLLKIIKNFHLEHKKNYTFSLKDTEIEIVSYKLVAIMSIGKTKVNKLNNRKIINNYKNDDIYRKVKFFNYGVLKTKILNRNNIKQNQTYRGPLIVEEDTSTLLINPKQTMKVDKYGILKIKI
tara:strand:- start:386 stop:889 length:504 start_codon:yes stop_codon:yes gene_type:complete